MNSVSSNKYISRILYHQKAIAKNSGSFGAILGWVNLYAVCISDNQSVCLNVYMIDEYLYLTQGKNTILGSEL